jgi:hypothetical protein
VESSAIGARVETLSQDTAGPEGPSAETQNPAKTQPKPSHFPAKISGSIIPPYHPWPIKVARCVPTAPNLIIIIVILPTPRAEFSHRRIRRHGPRTNPFSLGEKGRMRDKPILRVLSGLPNYPLQTFHSVLTTGPPLCQRPLRRVHFALKLIPTLLHSHPLTSRLRPSLRRQSHSKLPKSCSWP